MAFIAIDASAIEIPLSMLIVFGSAKLLAEIFERLGQPGIVGEIIAGVLVGPSVLNWIQPSEILSALAELGVMFLLFRVGMEVKASELMKVGGTAFLAAVLGVIVPFAMGWGIMLAWGFGQLAAIFMGAALVATSVGITAQVLSTRGLLYLESSKVILGAAVIDDVLGLLVLAAVSSAAKGQINLLHIATTAVLALGFTAIVAKWGTRTMSRLVPHAEQSLRAGETQFNLALVLLFGLSVLAVYAGVAAIIGAFLAGMALAESVSHRVHDLAQGISELLVPFFLAGIGLRFDLTAFSNSSIITLAIVISIAAVASKLIGCGLGAWRLGFVRMTQIGVGMVPRGEVGMVVAQIGFTMGVVDKPIYAVGGAQLPAAMVSYVDGLNVKARIAEDPALLLTIDFSPRPFPIDPSRVNDSSSKGPNNDLAIKPDLVAVGTSVYTAAPGSAYLAASGTSFSAPMVAGAAALLKAARPGLTAQQYRSLLVNSAGKLGSGLPSQHTGAGILNLGAALRATVIANPPSIAFNAGSGTVDLTRTFTLQNISRAADIYTISVVSGNEAVPSVSTTTVQLGPGSSRDIQVRFQGDNLAPRAYEGILVVRGTQSDVESHIPYWYAVRSQNAALISVIEPSSRGALSSRQRLRFRVLDGAGVPLMADPKVTVEQGGGLVLDIASLDAAYPGVFLANVRLGEAAGDNIFFIEAAGITRRITITGE